MIYFASVFLRRIFLDTVLFKLILENICFINLQLIWDKFVMAKIVVSQACQKNDYTLISLNLQLLFWLNLP